jgi:hypothetical protein
MTTKETLTIDDYLDWNKLILHVDSIDLTEEEKLKVKAALKFLKNELGEGFLCSGFQVKHPILGNFIFNQAPWTRKWLYWFAESLKELKDHEGYYQLVERLKDADKYHEALSVFKMAVKLSYAGFKIAFDQTVQVSNRIKKPDIKITNPENGEIIYVEVSIQGQNYLTKEASTINFRIHDQLWKHFPKLNYSGKILKSLSESHLESILLKLNRVVEKVLKENSFYEFKIEGIIEIGISPSDDTATLELWSKKHDLKVGEFIGPKVNTNELQRLRGKIDAEQKQLPNDSPGIVIINNNNLYLGIQVIDMVISELEEYVYRFPHLLFSVIYADYFCGRRESLIKIKDQHVYVVKPTDHLHTEEDIVLFNQFCKHKISPSTIAKVYNAFRTF